MVPRPKYSQPSFSSLKTSFFFLFLCISQLESWNLKALHKYLSVKDIRSDFQFAHFSWGDWWCWLGIFFFFFFLKSSFVAKLENRWETVWPFWFPSFLVEPQFYRFFRLFLSYFRFFIITKPICILVHSQTGWTGQSDPVFKTMIYIWVVCYYHNVLYKLNISLTMYL